MAYNYFVCRRHVPPVRIAAAQPNNLPNTYASPMCPTCGKTMERYDTGASPIDRRPLPPPGPPPAATLEDLPGIEVIYTGVGMNPGHGKVTWRVTRNPKKASILFNLKLGEERGGQYDATLMFKMADGLIDTGQGGDKEDWLVKPPFHSPATNVWHRINLGYLVNDDKLDDLPKTLDIGVKLGNSYFGLIHLLAGHSASVRKVGPYSIPAEANPDDSQYVTMLALQAGMQRFDNNAIRQINYDKDKGKLLIRGSHSGLIVVTRNDTGTLWTLTTIYNTSSSVFGKTIYQG